MKYQAITIDTQTVYANNRQLDRGNVAQLQQYKDGPIQFVLSEIVLRELIKLFEEKAKASYEALTKAIKDGSVNGQLTVDQMERLELVLDAMASPSDHAKTQLKDFIAKTNAHIVAAESAPMKPLLDAYFGGHPPFSNKGKKKEFPDAISLLAIENWAKSENKKVLAVSNDGDWKSFAEKSEWIDCVDDLATAMNALLEGVEAIEVEGRRVLQNLIDSDPPELRNNFVKFLEHATENEYPYLEYSSDMQASEDYASLTLSDIDFVSENADDMEVTILRITDEGFVMRVPLNLKIDVEAEISFSVHDSIDDDDVSMGSSTVEREVEVEAFALVHCLRHEEQAEDGTTKIAYEIEDVELVDFPSSIDIGHVEHSLADDYPDYDPEEWVPETEKEQDGTAVKEADEVELPF